MLKILFNSEPLKTISCATSSVRRPFLEAPWVTPAWKEQNKTCLSPSSCFSLLTLATQQRTYFGVLNERQDHSTPLVHSVSLTEGTIAPSLC